MSRLVAFGCSFTYGDSLDDTLDNPGPSKFAWPNLVANKMNLDCDNRAVCGLSNLGIVDKILNYTFKDTDTVVVMWTFFERDLLWLNKNDSFNLTVGNPNVDEELIHAWSTVHNVTDRRIRAWYNIHHIYNYLKSININFYFLHTHQEREFMWLKPQWANNINFLPTKFTDFRHLPLAADGTHPGAQAHSFMASHIYQHINSPEFSNQS